MGSTRAIQEHYKRVRLPVRGGGCDAFRIHFQAPADALQGPRGRRTRPARRARVRGGRIAGKDGPVMSTAEPGSQPATFRAMFVGELRARREHAGLLQREFAQKAHVSVSSVKQYEAGKKKPG